VRQLLIRIAVGVGVMALVAAVLFGAATTHYFDTKWLDPRPYPLRAVELQPPKEKNGIEYYGKLRMDVYIDADGAVDHVDAHESLVPQAFRDEAARAFSQVRWEPGRLWGMRVKSVKRIEVDIDAPPGVNAPLSTR
jgi:hypothetical protein